MLSAHTTLLAYPLCVQISSFSVHHSGALLLESRDGDTLDAFLRRTARRSSVGGPGTRGEAGAGRGPEDGGGVAPAAAHSDEDDLSGGESASSPTTAAAAAAAAAGL